MLRVSKPAKEFTYDESKKNYLSVKYFFDRILGCLALIITLPLLLIIALAIRIVDGRGIFYKQVRIGRYGKKFYIYKFRTMKKNNGRLKKHLTPEEYKIFIQNYKLENDQRITRLGNFLRKSSLDELPQLLNIIKGNMSFIGPRPVLMEETLRYGAKRDLLLSIHPGLTGYWQVNGRSDTTYKQRIDMELYYCEHFCLMLDAKIFFKTFVRVFTGTGAR